MKIQIHRVLLTTLISGSIKGRYTRFARSVLRTSPHLTCRELGAHSDCCTHAGGVHLNRPLVKWVQTLLSLDLIYALPRPKLAHRHGYGPDAVAQQILRVTFRGTVKQAEEGEQAELTGVDWYVAGGEEAKLRSACRKLVRYTEYAVYNTL